MQEKAARWTFLVCLGSFLLWMACIYLRTWGPPEWGPEAGWRNSWRNWDAKHYFEIAKVGYPRDDPHNIAFPPGYPLLVRGVAQTVGLSFNVTAMLVNLICLVAWAYIFCRYCRLHFGLDPPLCCLWFFCLPATYFALPAYSDTLFNMLFWLAIWSSLDRARPAGKLLVGLCLVLPWIRITGYSLGCLILRPNKRAAVLALLVTLLGWLLFNQAATGDALTFLRSQDWFGMPHGGLVQGVSMASDRLATEADANFRWKTATFPVISLVACMLACAWLARQGKLETTLVLLSVLALSHNQALWRSTVRYDWLVHPIVGIPLMVALTRASRQGSVRLFLLLAALATPLIGFLMHQQGWLAREFQSGFWGL